MTDGGEREPGLELERLVRLIREWAGPTAAASLAEALAADEPFPEGMRGRRLLARAKAAIGAEPPSLATLVVRAIGEVIEVLAGDTGVGQVIAPVAVRGDLNRGVLFMQQLGERSIAAHIDAREGDRFVMMLDFGVDAAARGTRVTLFKDEREVASDALRQGRVLLPELTAGRWHVEVRDSDGWVGALDLQLMSRAA